MSRRADSALTAAAVLLLASLCVVAALGVVAYQDDSSSEFARSLVSTVAGAVAGGAILKLWEA